MPVYIYALVDPRTDAVRYIGASQKPRKRVMAAKHTKGKHKRAWVAELEALGQKPVLRIIEAVSSGDDWEERERHWITQYGGTDTLLNESIGGRGIAGVVRSDELRTRMRNSNPWANTTPEQRAARANAISATLLRRWEAIRKE